MAKSSSTECFVPQQVPTQRKRIDASLTSDKKADPELDKQQLEQKKREAGTWVEDKDLPPVGVKVSASTRDPTTVKGVQHKKCPAKGAS